MAMDEAQVRALVRQAIARHLGSDAGTGRRGPGTRASRAPAAGRFRR